MAQNGFIFSQYPTNAVTIIINTCAFIQVAVEESIAVIMELRSTAPDAILVVAGCLPLRYRDDLVESLTEADLFTTPSQLPYLADIIQEAIEQRRTGPIRKKKRPCQPVDKGSLVRSNKTQRDVQNSEQPPKNTAGRIITTPGYAYLKIADGCNRQCRYCTIPKIRGRFKSSPFDELVDESRWLADMGVKEIILVAQDTVRYGHDLSMKNGLLKLIQAIAEIRGIEWIRLMYLHPHGIPSNLPQLVNECDKLLPYLDIPFQHVAEKILRNMGRPWKGDYIRKLVDTLRTKISGLVLRTTFMVGFPGEGEAEYKELREFAESYRIDHVGVFEYSREDNTRASALGDPVSVAVKKHRAEELRAMHLKSAAKRNRERIGQWEKAIIHGLSSETEYLLEGRLWHQAPEVDGVLYITEGISAPGEIHEVLLSETYETDFFGAIQCK